MIGILNYRAGNLQNLKNALDYLKVPNRILDSPEQITGMQKIIFPGVGAFGHAARNLKEHGFWDPLLEAVQKKIPLLGICVGMQLLFSQSTEDGTHEGLNLIAGNVNRFQTSFKVPQIGWNTVDFKRSDPLLEGLENKSWFYFVHSYACHPVDEKNRLGSTTYDQSFCSIVRNGKIWGVQFHPEKSQDAGLRLLKNFAEQS